MQEIRLALEDLAERWNGRDPEFLRLGKHIVYRLQDVELFEEQKLRQASSSRN